jgi:Flp pilus assembly CpaE family ATPase
VIARLQLIVGVKAKRDLFEEVKQSKFDDTIEVIESLDANPSLMIANTVRLKGIEKVSQSENLNIDLKSYIKKKLNTRIN